MSFTNVFDFNKDKRENSRARKTGLGYAVYPDIAENIRVCFYMRKDLVERVAFAKGDRLEVSIDKETKKTQIYRSLNGRGFKMQRSGRNHYLLTFRALKEIGFPIITKSTDIDYEISAGKIVVATLPEN